MRNLIGEIHRRSLWQVLGIYLGASWLVLQAVDTLAGALSLPDWSASLALFLLIIGLPIVLATAFVQGGAERRTAVALASTGAAAAKESDAAPEPAATVPEAPEVGPHGLFTWRNAILGGVGAFALVGILTAGWLLSRTLGIGPAATLQARGILEDQALVVLADFESSDPEIAAAATEALRVDLSQSGAIRLADRSLIEEALQRMQRDPGEPLTAEVAREVARREGAGAVLEGQISRAGDGYVFSAELVSAADGSTLTSHRESAADGTEVVGAIEALSKRLRERMGESLGSIRAGEPLQRVTTSDLEALELYSRASREGAGDRRIALYEQAIARDSGFAMAWNALAVALRNRRSERDRELAARARVYELRDRLTRRERLLATAMYHLHVTGDHQAAAGAYEEMLELDPLDVTATNNLGLIYSELRRHDLANEYYEKAAALEPDEFGPAWWNLVQTQIHLGAWDDAWATIDTIEARFANSPGPYMRTLVATNQGDFELADSLYRAILGFVPPGQGGRVNGDYGAMLGTLGRVEEARDRFDLAAGSMRETSPTNFWRHVLQSAWMELLVLDRPNGAIATIEAARRELPLDSLPALDRPYAPLAELLARAGRAEEARGLMTELEREISPGFLDAIRNEVTRAEGEIALAAGRYDDAIAAFRRSDAGQCTICALTGLGAAYDRAGQTDSAIAVYTRYVETPFPDRYASYAYALGPALGPTLERLGQLHEAGGDAREAARYYAELVELWADADVVLEPRVRAAQSRVEAIMREIG